MYEDVLVKPEHNIKARFVMKFANGTMKTSSKLDPMPYPYQTTIQYRCKKGYESVTKTLEQNIKCGPAGRWKPKLYGCISN